MANRLLQRGVSDPHKCYVSHDIDSSLPSLLTEAMKLLEARFMNLDQDMADTLTFTELSNELSLVGFTDEEKLGDLFRRVDTDKSGTLNFSEFLSLLYLWHNVANGDYSAFFKHPSNAKIVAEAFASMEAQMTKYDVDKSRRLDVNELHAFFQDQWPAATAQGSGVLETVLPLFTKAGRDLSFPGFMLLLYTVACSMPGSNLNGKYAPQPRRVSTAFGVGPDSQFWRELVDAFAVLETDFRRFDKDNSGLITFAEITAGMPPTRPGYDRLQIISKLEHAFQHVDFDGSETLDFHEFMYMGFNMTRSGSYLDLVQDSSGARMVKGMFIHLHAFYTKYDVDGNKRLTYDELEQLCRDKFLAVPPNLPALFEFVKYQSSATEGRSAVDMVRFMKLLYMLVCPTGAYHPSRYDPTRNAVPPPRRAASSEHPAAAAAAPAERPPRIDPVVPARFQRGKLLGQGGQGTVYAGSYDGIPCAGKVLLGDMSEDVVKAARAEVAFFLRLDHPNCHYMLGAKTTVENGGMLFLTEVCANGSLFDYYATKRRTFSGPTAVRLALECAQGLQHIHAMGFMHRDVKSLNVFLSEGMVAKMADFGMCTPEPSSNEPGGTPQWMAPEVVRNLFNLPTSYGRSVDVYSFGILLWELTHCRVPYAETGLNQMAVAQAVLKQGIRPRISQACPPPLRELMTACWNGQSTSRPTFHQIVDRLKVL